MAHFTYSDYCFKSFKPQDILNAFSDLQIDVMKILIGSSSFLFPHNLTTLLPMQTVKTKAFTFEMKISILHQSQCEDIRVISFMFLGEENNKMLYFELKVYWSSAMKLFLLCPL